MSLNRKKILSIATILLFNCLGCNNKFSSTEPTQPTELNSLLFMEKPYSLAPFSAHAFDNIIELRAQLPDFSDPSLMDQAAIAPQLLQQFPKISGSDMADIFNSIKQLKIDQATGKSLVKAGLELCPCEQIAFSDRILTILLQTNALLKKVSLPKRSKKIVHTTFGEESYLQSYMLALALSKVGFKDVDIYGIGSVLDSFNKNKQLYQSYFSSLPGIHLLNHFASIYDYLDAIDNGTAYKSHSFDIIDVGPYHDALKPAEANKRFKISGFVVRGTRFQVAGGFGQYFIVSVGKGRVHQSSCVGNYKDIYENFQKDVVSDENEAVKYAQPMIDDYCSGILSVLDAADDNADFKALIQNFSQTWLSAKSLQVQNIFEYRRNAWDEFAGLVDMGKAPHVNPVIVLLQSNMIAGPVEYTGQFVALGGKNLGFNTFEFYQP